MADYYYARISIPLYGIENNKEIKEIFVKEVSSNSHDFSYEDFVNILSFDDDFIGLEIKDGIVHFENVEARYGEFKDLEEALVENHIPYDRYTSDNYDCECNYTEWYRPELKSVRWSDVIQEETVFSGNKIKELINGQDESLSDRDVLETVVNYINENSPYSDRYKLENYTNELEVIL